MSNPLKHGDLAIVIKSIDGLAVGKIVECIRIDGTHSQHGIIWLVKSTSGNLVSEYGAVGDHMHMAQDWLKKIPNEKLEDDTLVMKELELNG